MGKNKIDRTCIQKIAEEAGVSTATVSRVFNRHPYVSSETRDKVLAAAQKNGYAPTITTTNKRFGVLVGTFSRLGTDAYIGQMLPAISRQFFELGCDIQLISRENFPYLLHNSYSGVIVFNSSDTEIFRKLQIPCLVVNNPTNGVCNIATDHFESLRIAVEYLLKLNHRRIAFLHSLPGNWGSSERLRGYHSALDDAGVPQENRLTEIFTYASDIPLCIRKLLTRKPTALIVEGESNGLVADHALKQLGISIPDDLSLITFENKVISAFATPPHTTIFQDFEELGTYAAKTLVNYVLLPPSKRILTEPRFFHNRLIERASCAPLPAPRD